MVDLQELTEIADTLQQLSARYYGPRCPMTLMTSSTGKAVVTSDGLTIIEAVSLSHPVADMIVSALKKCHTATYDGSKTFLLYLKFFLKHLIVAVNQGKFTEGGTYNHHTNRSCHEHSKVCAARSINNVSDQILPEVFLKLTRSLQIQQYRNGNLFDILRKVCQGTLIPHFNEKQCIHFSETLIKIINNSTTIPSAKEILQLVTAKFNQLCIKVPGRNYTDTTAVEPLLIRKSKQFKNLLLNEKDTGAPIKAVCVQFSDENSEDEEPDIGMIVKDKSLIHESLQVRRNKVNKFAMACVGLKISLIICCDSLPDYFLNILHQHGLTVLTNVYKEDIDLLELFTHTTSVTSLQGHIDDVNIISLTKVDEVTIGIEQFIHVKSDKFKFKHVIVCAPSQGLCDQTALLLQKAIHSMYLSLETELVEIEISCSPTIEMSSFDKQGLSNDDISIVGELDQLAELNVIPVGGTFELMLSELLIDKSKAISDPHVKEICNILSETLIDVLRVLYENRVSSSNKHGTRFIDVKLQMIDRMRNGQIGALDANGKVCDNEEKVMLEPLKVKIHVLHSVLNLMHQLLRVDDVIPIKTL